MKTLTIPRIIHHIAPEDESSWHPIWKRCRDSFTDNFEDYEHKLWNDRDDIDRLVYDHYRKFWNLYSNLPYHIMKVDFVRLFILHKYGGMYADMDYYCYRNFGEYLTKENLFVENTSPLYTNADYENCLMASKSNSEFIFTMIRNVKHCFIQNRYMFNTKTKDWRDDTTSYAVNNTTGSGILDACIKSYGHHFSVGKFPADVFNQDPIVYNDQLIGRHLHSSLWGDDYLTHSSRECFAIKEGNIWNCSREFLETEPTAQRWKEFDFYIDYKGATVE